MAKIIFNKNFGVDNPTLLLTRRDFSKIGLITDATNIEYKDTLSAPELSFTVYKSNNNYSLKNWEDINNYNLIFIPEYNEYFSMCIDTNEENATQKTVVCTYLPISELKEVKLRDIEINTEEDIMREDYDANYPTIFYRDLSKYEIGSDIYNKMRSASLLHRVLEKASNYKIGHVDANLVKLNTWFQYSISDSNVYDILTGEISEDYQCLFKFDSNTRTINVYDLCNTCLECGYRGDFHEACPECGQKNFNGAYGTDTTIYISKENLSTSSSIESNKDNLKNCLYVVGGDDLITAAVAMVNPTGTNYIIQFSDEMYENMPVDLREKLKQYNTTYQTCMNTQLFEIPNDVAQKYNSVVDYINIYYPLYDENGNKTKRYDGMPINIVGYKNLSSFCFDCIDIDLILQSSMGKTIEMDSLSISETMDLLTSSKLSPVSVKTSLSTVATAVVTNTVLGSCKSLINTSLYKVEIIEDAYSPSSNIWSGKIKLTSIEDKTVSLIGSKINLVVNNDMETYLKQNIQRNLNKLDTNYKDLRKFDIDDNDFIAELKYYSFDFISNLKNAYGDVLSVILASDDKALQTEYQNRYYDRIKYIENELNVRQSQINIVRQLYDYNNQNGIIYNIQTELHDRMNLELYLGKDMWKTFCSYRMEDTYQNDNFVSDGLNNGELITRANELLLMAKRELQKISNVQYVVTSTINNLLALREFQPIVNQFEIGNWIHVCVDGKIYYLRLLSYKIFYDDISKIDVEFSTVEKVWSGISDTDSVLQYAQSVVSSYSYTTQKVKNTAKTSQYVENWVQKGLDATATKIVNNAENQNIVYDSTGLLCRTYDDLTDMYDPCQSRFINSGLYVTDDNWKAVKAAVGKYIYADPVTGEEKNTMGIIGDTIVGKMVAAETLKIYGSNNSIILDENGVTLDGGSITWKTPISSSAVSGFDIFKSNVENSLGVTSITVDSVISPKIGGGYLYIKKEGGCGVEINPLGNNYNGKSGDVFSITNGSNKKIMSVDVNGNGYFSGKITANSGTIGGFTIGTKSIYNGTNSMSSTAAGVYLGTDGIKCSNFKSNNNGNVYMVSPYISSSIYMSGLGYFDDDSGYSEIVSSTIIHGKTYPCLKDEWLCDTLNCRKKIYFDMGDSFGTVIDGNSIFVNPLSNKNCSTTIGASGITTNGDICFNSSKRIISTFPDDSNTPYNILYIASSGNLHLGADLYSKSVKGSSTYVSAGNNLIFRAKLGTIGFQLDGENLMTIDKTGVDVKSGEIFIRGVPVLSKLQELEERLLNI